MRYEVRPCETLRNVNPDWDALAWGMGYGVEELWKTSSIMNSQS